MNDCYFEKKDWRECKQEVRFSDLIFFLENITCEGVQRTV